MYEDTDDAQTPPTTKVQPERPKRKHERPAESRTTEREALLLTMVVCQSEHTETQVSGRNWTHQCQRKHSRCTTGPGHRLQKYMKTEALLGGGGPLYRSCFMYNSSRRLWRVRVCCCCVQEINWKRSKQIQGKLRPRDFVTSWFQIFRNRWEQHLSSSISIYIIFEHFAGCSERPTIT